MESFDDTLEKLKINDKFKLDESTINTLIDIREPVIDVLIESLNHHYTPIKRHAEETLLKIGKPAIRRFIVELMKHNRRSRKKILALLEKLGWKPENKMEEVHYLLAKRDWKKLMEIGTDTIPYLLPQLGREDFLIYISINYILTKICVDNLHSLDLNIFIDYFKDTHEDYIVMRFFRKILTKIDTVILGDNIFRVEKGYLRNPDLTRFPSPLMCLEHLMIDVDSCLPMDIERFVTYAINIIGEKKLRRNLNVTVHENIKKLNANQLNLLKNISKGIGRFS
ncbi:MAG: hypothetical protein JW969_20220 [Spirochaetales bacterium]|nr:hypothetical protein [Spirochaetales bacterium]